MSPSSLRDRRFGSLQTWACMGLIGLSFPALAGSPTGDVRLAMQPVAQLAAADAIPGGVTARVARAGLSRTASAHAMTASGSVTVATRELDLQSLKPSDFGDE